MWGLVRWCCRCHYSDADVSCRFVIYHGALVWGCDVQNTHACVRARVYVCATSRQGDMQYHSSGKLAASIALFFSSFSLFMVF
jgi:hypothetical protein